MKKESYVVISEWMLDLGLSSKELMVYALVYGVCSHNQSYYGTLEHTAKWARCCKDTAGDALASLVKKGLLVKKEKYDGTKKFCFYSIGSAEPPAGGETPPPGGEDPGTGGGNPPAPEGKPAVPGGEEGPAAAGETPEPIGKTPMAIGKTPMAIGKTPMAIGETPMAPSVKHRSTDLVTDLNLQPNTTSYGVGGFVDKDLDFAQAWETIVGKWNETPLLGRERKKSALNLTVGEQEAVRKALSLYRLEEVLNGIDNYIDMYERPDKYRTALTYGSVFNFLAKALPTFAEDAAFRSQYYKRGAG